MSVEKRNGGYCVRWRDATGKARSQQVKLWRDAVTLDGEIKRKKSMGELVFHERGTTKLGVFWDLWWDRYALVHLTPKTQTLYKLLWRKHIDPQLGHAALRDIHAEHVVDLTRLLTHKLSPATVGKCLVVLQGVMQRAVEWRYIPMNPVVGVKKPKIPKSRGRALTVDQVEAICKELDWRSQTIVRMLAQTGMRPSELRALEWDDITDTAINVERAASGDVVGQTKTGNMRQIVLRPETHSLLNRWQLARGGRYGLVFPGPGYQEKLWTEGNWKVWQRKTFTPAIKRAGLRGVVPYDLRHTFVSTLIAENRDIYWVARQAGHSPVQMLSTYAHLFESQYQGGFDDRKTFDPRLMGSSFRGVRSTNA